MTLIDQTQFDAFFREYATNVDGFDEAPYWRLSDELIKELIRRHLNPTLGQCVLDAGGGNGRWAAWMVQEFGVEVVIADKSADMLREAEAKLNRLGLQDRVKLVSCDLTDPIELESDSADLVVSTYGVLSFLEDPQATFDHLRRILRPGGAGLLMGHSQANALASKAGQEAAHGTELEEILTRSIVRWAPHVPPLRVFNGSTLTALAEDAGFDVEGLYGVTSIVMPGPEDFGYPYETLSAVSRSLAAPEFFAAALRLELAASAIPAWAERGVNLMIKIRRPAL